MKRFAPGILLIVLLALTAFALQNCGSSHSSGSGSLTITSNSEAALAGSAAVTSARTVTVIGSALAMISEAITNSGGIPLAPPAGTSGAGAGALSMGVLSEGLTPALRQVIADRATVTLPATIDCATNTTVTGGTPSTPDSVTITATGLLGPFTATFNACREGATQIDGIVTASLTGVTAFTLTLGAGTAPLIVTEFGGTTSSTVASVLNTLSTISFSRSGAIDTYSATGSFENWDYGAHGHEKLSLSNLKIDVATGTATIEGRSYNADTFTVNGPLTGTVYVSDTDSTVKYTETGSYTNFAVLDKTPASGLQDFTYLTVTGTFSLSTTPATQCIDGTFTIATSVDVQINDSTGATVAGQITVNETSTVLFNADGGMTVTVGSGAGAAVTYTGTQTAAMCSL